MNLGNVVIEPELNSNRELKDSIKTEILSHYERPTQDFTLFIYRPQGRPADGLEEAMGKHMKNWCEDSVILIIDYDGHVDTTGLGLSSELKGLITETFVMKSSHGAVDKGDSTTEKALERIDRILTTKFGMKRKIDRQDQLIGRNHEDRISPKRSRAMEGEAETSKMLQTRQNELEKRRLDLIEKRLVFDEKKLDFDQRRLDFDEMRLDFDKKRMDFDKQSFICKQMTPGHDNKSAEQKTE